MNPTPSITEITLSNYKKEVLQSDKLVLLCLYRSGAPESEAQLRNLLEYASLHKGRVKVAAIDMKQYPNYPFAPSAIPCLATMKKGEWLFSQPWLSDIRDIGHLVEISEHRARLQAIPVNVLVAQRGYPKPN